MKIAGFALYRFRLPLTDSLTLKGTTLEHREGLLLRLDGEDGEIGWGETSPLPGFSREVLPDATRGLSELARSVVDREMTDAWIGAYGGLARELDGADLAPSVRFGFELAIWNLYAATRGVALPAVISQVFGDVVSLNGLLAGPPAGALEEARRMRDAGYEAVKLKVGARTVEEDVALVRAVGEALGRGVALRLDANRAWTLDEALEFARGIEGLRVEYLEEPLADPAGLKALTQASGLPVALDESLVGMAPESLGEHRYAGAVVLKPSFLGGLSRVLRLAERAASLGMRPVVSSAYETGVGTASLVALAAGIGGGGIPAGLDPYRRLAGDVVEPRLPLPAPHVSVREAVAAGRGVVLRRLSPQAQGVG
ncbi:MAG: o-succinylbenzoate synthase [Actinobacteria bacterium]|nr:MAG: o-succinylbenzoate synthase [Actinomycetota bacterium]